MARLPSLAALALALGGCTTPAPPPPADPLAGIPEQRLAVGYLDVSEAFPAATGTFIDKRHSEELQTAARSYLTTRLAAAGGPSTAKATILEASVIEERRPVQNSLGAPFMNAPDTSLKGRVEVRVAIVGARGTELGFASAKVERARSVPNVSTVPERERLAQDMIREMVKELDKALSNSIRQNLSEYLTL
jgi:hypothetical protein